MTTERLDPRQQRTRATVLAAARTVLRRDGVHGTTFDAIAAEAGVARSTLYRNWKSREQLLDDAIGQVAAPATTADDRPPIERLNTVLNHLADRLEHSEWGATLPAIVAAIDASPEFADRYRHFVDTRRADAAVIIRAALDEAEASDPADTDDLVDALVGPLFYRRLVRRLPTPPEWVAEHVERILRANT